ncbi:MAG: zinc ribbon domain-containing protein [Planctomycetota bacterium]
MPIYEYCCETCGVFEALRPFSESDSPAVCPDCGTTSPRVLSVPMVRLLDPGVRMGMERNEKSRHEPERRSARNQGPKKDANGQPQLKASSGSRPWMI